VAEDTGVSERPVRRILKEGEEHEEQGTSFGTLDILISYNLVLFIL
jgi:hypothetical protein